MPQRKSDDVLFAEAIAPLNKNILIIYLIAFVSSLMNLNMRDVGFCPIREIISAARPFSPKCQILDINLIIIGGCGFLLLVSTLRVYRAQLLILPTLALLFVIWIFEHVGRLTITTPSGISRQVFDAAGLVVVSNGASLTAVLLAIAYCATQARANV